MNRNALRWICALAACQLIWTVARAHAQVEVICRVDPIRVLLYEQIPAQVLVRNVSGAPLQLGGEGAEAVLRLDVEYEPGRFLPCRVDVLPGLPVMIAPGDTAKIPLELGALYPMQRTGQYIVTACVTMDGRDHLASKAFLDISPGLEQASVRAGAPDGSRVYTLRSLYRDGVEGLFLRIEDPDGRKVYGVLDLGSFIKLYPPVLYVDRLLRVHAFYQISAGQFAEGVFDAYGKTIDRSVYRGSLRNVRIEPAPDGGVIVEGASLQDKEGTSSGGGWRIRKVPR